MADKLILKPWQVFKYVQGRWRIWWSADTNSWLAPAVLRTQALILTCVTCCVTHNTRWQPRALWQGDCTTCGDSDLKRISNQEKNKKQKLQGFVLSHQCYTPVNKIMYRSRLVSNNPSSKNGKTPGGAPHSDIGKNHFRSTKVSKTLKATAWIPQKVP